MQNFQASALPPAWKATWAWVVSTGEVKVYE